MTPLVLLLRRPLVALLLDVVFVVVFAAVGWVVVRALRRAWPLEVSPGVTVWFATVLVGLVLRRATGQGTAASFVLVAAVVLALFLLGWWALAALARRRAAVGN